jgi:hypothetical protein
MSGYAGTTHRWTQPAGTKVAMENAEKIRKEKKKRTALVRRPPYGQLFISTSGQVIR